MSDSSWPHELLHTRPLCPPVSLEFTQTHVHWVDNATQPSHPLSSPFSSCLQSFPASGPFPVSQLFASGGQSTGASFPASVLPVNIQGCLPLGLTGFISLLSKGLSGVFSSATIWRHQFLGTQASLWSNSCPSMATRKTMALPIQTCAVCKV